MTRRFSFAALTCAAALGVLVGSAMVVRGPEETRVRHSIEPELLKTAEASARQPSTSVLEPLNTRVLVSRTIETFPTGYLTLIAIIQGVALAILAQFAIPLIFALDPSVKMNRVLVAGESAAGFVTIVITSYMYMWFTTVMRWVPTFWDTFIPYALGVGEIVPFFLLQRPTDWWIAMTCLGTIGVGAFTHTLVRSSEEAFGDRPEAYRRSKTLLTGLLLFAIAWAVSSGVAAFVFTNTSQLESTAALAPWLYLITGAAMIGFSERILKAVHADYGIERKIRTA